MITTWADPAEDGGAPTDLVSLLVVHGNTINKWSIFLCIYLVKRQPDLNWENEKIAP